MTKIFLARHASPDWNRKDLPYDIHPGPPLSPKGEQEAASLADFLKAQGVLKLYYSPFERAASTALLIAARNRIPAVEEKRLAEWRKADEKQEALRARMWLLFDELVETSTEPGPVALVSHGAPISSLLLALGLDEATLSEMRNKFDGYNPLPPAGAWSAEWDGQKKAWNLELVFIP